MSAMSEDTRLVHACLEEWASFVRGEASELGFPPETYLARWIRYGIDGASQHGKPPTMPDRISVIDAAIARLQDQDRRVIQAYYLDWAPRETLAGKLRMSTQRFDRVLSRARREVYWTICATA